MSPRIGLLAVGLLILTVVYNFAEGVLSVWSGLRAESIVLTGFGIDSYLEVMAAGAVLWRMTYRDEEEGEQAERRTMRLIGVTFVLLAAGIAFQSVMSLIGRNEAEGSTLGLAVLVASVALMPALSLTKLWVASRAQMPVLAAEARETVACAYLSLTALVGAGAVLLLGWWWVDAVAALFMTPWLLREGLEGLRGECCFDDLRPCFCRSCFYGLRACQPLCCDPVCC